MTALPLPRAAYNYVCRRRVGQRARPSSVDLAPKSGYALLSFSLPCYTYLGQNHCAYGKRLFRILLCYACFLEVADEI